MSQRVTWVLDADIRSFFDSVDHQWLLRMLAHRVADPRIMRLVRMWLEVGILENGDIRATDRGTPQGAGMIPSNAKGNFDRLTGHGGDRALPGRDPAEVLNRRGCNAG